MQNGISEVQRRRMQREHEEAAREELMTMTFRPNNQDMALNIDHALEHNTSLNRINSVSFQNVSHFSRKVENIIFFNFDRVWMIYGRLALLFWMA